MSETTPTPETPKPKAGGSSWVQTILVMLVLCAIAGGIYGYIYYQNQVPAIPDEMLALKGFQKESEKYTKMAKEYTDANGDLIADTTTDASKQLDPAELVFTLVAGDDAEQTIKIWEPFRKHLEAKTGKKIKFLSEIPVKTEEKPAEGEKPAMMLADTVAEQVDFLKSGQLHIAAFSTGQVPLAVNTGGFVPMFAPATKDGVYSYDAEVIVPVDSDIKDLKDLKGKQVAFVSLSSNSGGRAPIVRFHEKADLTVFKDYRFTITGSHETSILGVCIGRDAAPVLSSRLTSEAAKSEAQKKPGAKYEAASVASDLLAKMVSEGKVQAEQYRTLYKDGPFPPLCFGISHQLKPELAAKIKDAFSTFSFEGNSVGERYKSSSRVKFAPVDYKKDWQAVRDIDQKLQKVLGEK